MSPSIGAGALIPLVYVAVCPHWRPSIMARMTSALRSRRIWKRGEVHVARAISRRVCVWRSGIDLGRARRWESPGRPSRLLRWQWKIRRSQSRYVGMKFREDCVMFRWQYICTEYYTERTVHLLRYVVPTTGFIHWLSKNIDRVVRCKGVCQNVCQRVRPRIDLLLKHSVLIVLQVLWG